MKAGQNYKINRKIKEAVDLNQKDKKKKIVMLLELTISGTEYSSTNPINFNGNSITIDWGDGTVEESTTGILNHTYEDSGDHTVLIKGDITELTEDNFYQDNAITKINIIDEVVILDSHCFNDCDNLTEIHIPSTVTTIGEDCFNDCNNLTDIYLNWTEIPDGIDFNSFGENNSFIFHIPYGTEDIYIAKGFPKNQLIEADDADVIFRPPLDGTDELIEWTNMESKTSDGIFVSHGSLLKEGWSNEGLWSLEFDYKYTWIQALNDGGYIGLLLGTEEAIPFDDAYRDSRSQEHSIFCWEGGLPLKNKYTTVIKAPESYTLPNQKDWNHIQIIKKDENTLEVIFNYNYVWEETISNFNTFDVLHLGTRDNPATSYTRNSGGTVSFKNIVVKSISEEEIPKITYNFTSYGDAEGETEWGTGTAQTTGVISGEYTQIKVLTNSTDQDFVGNLYYIISNANPDGETLYQLYEDGGTTPTGIYVKVTTQ